MPQLSCKPKFWGLFEESFGAAPTTAGSATTAEEKLTCDSYSWHQKVEFKNQATHRESGRLLNRLAE